MTRIIDEFRQDDERILDRLVDGELKEEDRNALLGALDDEPGAWRRCALAFFKAQSWRGDFLSLRQEAPPPREEVTPTIVPVTRATKPSHFFELCLALAACVVMAFGVGIWVRSMWSAPGTPRSVDFAAGNPAPHALAPQTVSQWHRAKINFDDPLTQGPDSIEVPVREVENLTEDHLRQNRSALPDDVRRALESSGHRVIQRQQVLPIPTKNGDRVLVPVEQWDIEPQGRTPY